MNLFAVNAAEINGSIEIWSWYGSSDLALQASGELKIGAVLSGSSNVVLNSDAQAFARLFPTGQPAEIVLTSTGEAIYGRSGSGVSQIVLQSTADGTRWVLGASSSDIVIESDGDAQVVAPAAADFTIVLSTMLEERVTPAIQGVGVSLVVIDSSLDEKTGRAVRLEASSEIELASRAIGYLRINGPSTLSQIVLEADGSARFGRKIQLDPLEAQIELFARGEVGFRHYVYADGESVIELRAGSLMAGIPPIPTDYIPAPAGRTIIVARDPRELVVARENRSL